MNFIIILLSFFIFIVPIILIHELGHLFVGKLLGAKPKTFSIGFGKILFSKTIKGISIEWRAWPLGGFVDFNTTQFPQIETEKESLSQWKWILILLAGPVANILTFLTIILILQFQIYSNIQTRKIKKILIDDPMIQSKMIFIESSLYIPKISSSKNKLFFSINKDKIVFSNTDKTVDKSIFLSKIQLGKPEKLKLTEVITYSVENTLNLLGFLFKEYSKSIFDVVIGKSSLSESFSGPIEIAQLGSSNLTQGISSSLFFFGFLSFGLGFINLLPFLTILDGGKVLIAIITLIKKEDLPAKVLFDLTNISLILIFLLFSTILFNDIFKVIN